MFAHLEKSSTALNGLKGTKTTEKSAFEQWGSILYALEQKSALQDEKPWRFVFDAPTSDGKYIEDPVVQICSGSPDYHRFIMTFCHTGVNVRFDTRCIDPTPDLSTIQAQPNTVHPQETQFRRTSETPLTLEKRRQQDDEVGVQRIAILGAARVFIHGDQRKDEHHVELITNVQKQLNRFLDTYDPVVKHSSKKNEPISRFRAVNGGWAGSQEGSTGLPLISSFFGSLKGNKAQKLAATVMPQGGVYDRVQNIYPDNDFIIPGTWGHVNSAAWRSFTIPFW